MVTTLSSLTYQFLKSFYNLKSTAKVFDTIVATRLLFPDIKDQDFKHKNFPRDCIGRHSLKAWGNRVGEYKEQFDTDWKEFSVGMLEYCIQDVSGYSHFIQYD